MAAKRGAENLARFNDERSATTLPLLTHELQLCRKRKLEFKTVGLLAGYLSDRLKVHRTTFLRNVKYKGMLLSYIASQPGVVARTPDTTSDPAILQAKLAAARVEASNVTAELARVRAQLEQFQKGLPSLPSEGGGNNQAIAFSNLAMVLVNVLHRFPDFIALDRQARELHDLSAKPSQRVIVGKERIGEFIEWLETNQALPTVQALVLASAKR